MFTLNNYMLLFYSCLWQLTLATESLHYSNNNHPLLVDLSNRNTIATGIVAMLNDSFIQLRHKRVFNFYALNAIQPSQYKRGFYGELIDETLRRLSLKSEFSETITVRVGRFGYPLPGDSERHYSVLLVDCSDALGTIYENIAKYHLHISGFFIIVLHTFVPYYYDELFQIFELNQKIGIVDANVLVYALAHELLLFAAYPYAQAHCGGNAPVIQNRLFNGNWQRVDYNFFPDKLSNLYGCPLICATWTVMPYMELGNTTKNENLGIEGKLLEYLAVRLNFTLRFYWLNKEQIEQTVYNGTYIFDQLFKSGVDFAIGRFRYKPLNSLDTYAPTTSYYLSSFHLITVAKVKPYNAFFKLLFPFAIEIWFILAFCYLCGTLICLIINCSLNISQRNFIFGFGNRTPIYNMFIVSLGGTVASVLPARNFARYLLTLWLTTTLVLRSAYQAYMYHFIRHDINQPQPTSILDIIALNYTFVMSKFTHEAVKNLLHINNSSHIMMNSSFEAFEWLLSDAANSNGLRNSRTALITAYEYFGYYKLKRIHAAMEFHLLPEKVFTQQLSIYMRKNSVLLKRFNRFIMEYQNAGLMSKWEQVFIDTSVYAKREVVEEQPQPMQLAQLYGAFRLLLIGNICSFFVFLAELVFYAIFVCLSTLRRIASRIFVVFRVRRRRS